MAMELLSCSQAQEIKGALFILKVSYGDGSCCAEIRRVVTFLRDLNVGAERKGCMFHLCILSSDYLLRDQRIGYAIIRRECMYPKV